MSTNLLLAEWVDWIQDYLGFIWTAIPHVQVRHLTICKGYPLRLVFVQLDWGRYLVEDVVFGCN